ncbi:class I SAM-dependent methyltransferase [Rheinheimera texasensis]|uniref:class I SAM-dependent methyltransferase n=1 Tax=Rheinheimera texasensis TaxID=306205 RepID=UPI00068CB78F|nr:SAM-dependent methyltransferase [Rheinheimera texasensis]
MSQAEIAVPLAGFIRQFHDAFSQNQLLRLVLSRYAGNQSELNRIQIRPILLKTGTQLSVLFENKTFDQTKNFSPDELTPLLTQWLTTDFRAALLECNGSETQLTVSKKGKVLLNTRKTATAALAPAQSHNREKQRFIDSQAPFLRELGIAGSDGQIAPTMQKKWKQINKFIEIFARALKEAGLLERGNLTIADFGSGKAYLTFAVAHYLQQLALPAEVIGVELRQSLVDLCNTTAARLNQPGIRFEQGDVQHYQSTGLDVMIALHACDTATDHAIHMGIRAGASVIMCSPCCHKEIRPQLQSPAVLSPLLQHGIHLGQEAEMLTDGIRALLLEAHGYDTQVFEFIALEHTSKNKMILAVKREGSVVAARQQAVLAQISALKQFYGIRQHCLEALLVQGSLSPASLSPPEAI